MQKKENLNIGKIPTEQLPVSQVVSDFSLFVLNAENPQPLHLEQTPS